MKKSRFIWGLAPLAAGALLLPPAASAQTSFTATGWVNQVLAPGIWATNALGQMLARGVVQTARVESPDPRVAGQVFIITDGSLNADGTANIQGPAYLQVGTWDPAKANFTPSGAMWNLNWRGVMQTNYSFQLSIAGYGVGGSIDGLRLEETLTRGPAAGPIDPSVPFLYAGTVKPPPVSTNLFADDFSDSLTWTIGKGGGTVTMDVVDGQLVTHEDWTRVTPASAWFYAFAPAGAWSVGDGQTLECQADLISLSQNATNAAFVWVGTGSAYYQFNYESGSGPHTVSLLKGLSGGGQTFFWATNTVQAPSTNVVLYMALTRDKGNSFITTRLLDKSQQNAVVFERGFLDTPGVDGSLTLAQFMALTGGTAVPGFGAPDPGPPIFSGTHKGVGVWQVTDGGQPAVDAIFDNFALRLHDTPPLGIARAVRLSWPTPATINYTVESAPSPQGPWSPWQDLSLPGLHQITVPTSEAARFFRLQQAP